MMVLSELNRAAIQMDAKIAFKQSCVELALSALKLQQWGIENFFSWLKNELEFDFAITPIDVDDKSKSIRRVIFFLRNICKRIELHLWIEDKILVFTPELLLKIHNGAIIIWPYLSDRRLIPDAQNREGIIVNSDISVIELAAERDRPALTMFLDEDVICETFIDFPPLTSVDEAITYGNWQQFTSRLVDDLPWSYAIAGFMGQENYLGIMIPARAQVLRMLLLEWERIVDHLRVIHQMILQLSNRSAYATMFARLIDKILSNLKYPAASIILGGVHEWPSGEWFTSMYALLHFVQRECTLLFRLVTRARSWQSQTKISGMLASWARGQALSGPLLRAAGVGYDLRKQRGYYFYPEIDFDVPVGTIGDVHDIYLVRMEEIFNSIKIIQALLRTLPSSINALTREEIQVAVMAATFDEEGAASFVYSAIEASIGEIGIGICGTTCKLFSSGWRAINSWPLMIKGMTIDESLFVLAAMGIKSEEYSNNLFFSSKLSVKWRGVVK